MSDEEDGEWLTAIELKVGQKVLRPDGLWTSFTKITRETKPTLVYNLEVENNHNYFVGEIGVLSHNCEGVAKWAKGIQRYRHGNMTAIEHVIYRHGSSAGFDGVSKFSRGTTLRNISDLADEAVANGTRTGNAIVHDFGRVIGTDINGNPTTRVKVYLSSDDEIRTLFPF